MVHNVALSQFSIPSSQFVLRRSLSVVGAGDSGPMNIMDHHTSPQRCRQRYSSLTRRRLSSLTAMLSLFILSREHSVLYCHVTVS